MPSQEEIDEYWELKAAEDLRMLKEYELEEQRRWNEMREWEEEQLANDKIFY